MGRLPHIQGAFERQALDDQSSSWSTLTPVNHHRRLPLLLPPPLPAVQGFHPPHCVDLTVQPSGISRK
ncbi:hypothetical protein HanXRQr2_Chr11g0513671 [Helianthus annuus]|uniref:Uncharacterized protein n=1 Tax=Helianthus annuus TaxID=4232 RepID=A0A9K3HSY8_HELAN|nr:hypothetical protein HanXRQr2_Chr11g0513671 [Helianthus annuus]